MNRCPGCRSEVFNEDKFCGDCGLALVACQSCGQKMERDDAFCGHCGTTRDEETILSVVAAPPAAPKPTPAHEPAGGRGFQVLAVLAALGGILVGGLYAGWDDIKPWLKNFTAKNEPVAKAWKDLPNPAAGPTRSIPRPRPATRKTTRQSSKKTSPPESKPGKPKPKTTPRKPTEKPKTTPRKPTEKKAEAANKTRRYTKQLRIHNDTNQSLTLYLRFRSKRDGAWKWYPNSDSYVRWNLKPGENSRLLYKGKPVEASRIQYHARSSGGLTWTSYKNKDFRIAPSGGYLSSRLESYTRRLFSSKSVRTAPAPPPIDSKP